MDMDCPREGEKLSALVDRELPAVEQRRLARHVLHCPRCAEDAGRLLAAKLCLSSEPQPEAELQAAFWGRWEQAADLVDAVRLRLQQAARPHPRYRWAGALALAGVLLILLAVGLRVGLRPEPVAPDSLALAHEGLVERMAAAASPVPEYRPSLGFAPVSVGLPLPVGASAGARQQLYRLSSTPVSVFRLPKRGFSPAQMQTVSVGPHRYRLAVLGMVSVVAWPHGDHWHVLVAEIPPWQLLSLAESDSLPLDH